MLTIRVEVRKDGSFTGDPKFREIGYIIYKVAAWEKASMMFLFPNEIFCLLKPADDQSVGKTFRKLVVLSNRTHKTSLPDKIPKFCRMWIKLSL